MYSTYSIFCSVSGSLGLVVACTVHTVYSVLYQGLWGWWLHVQYILFIHDSHYYNKSTVDTHTPLPHTQTPIPHTHTPTLQHPHTGRVHEVKVDEVVDAEFLQLQYDRGQVGAEDLGVGVVLHLVLVGFLWIVEGWEISRDTCEFYTRTQTNPPLTQLPLTACLNNLVTR